MNISAVALSGMDEVQKKLEHTAERVARSESPVEDTVDLLSARNQFEASLKVLKVANEMDKNVINLLA